MVFVGFVLFLVIMIAVSFLIKEPDYKSAATKEENLIMKEEYDRKVKIGVVVGIIIFLIIFLSISSLVNSGSSSSNSGSDLVCRSCGRSFSRSSSNGRSIKNTNMCENCYHNYKAGSEALDDLKGMFIYTPVALFDDIDK